MRLRRSWSEWFEVLLVAAGGLLAAWTTATNDPPAPREPSGPGIAARLASLLPEYPYESPYQVRFQLPARMLIGDLRNTERGEPRFEAEIPHREWYSHRHREQLGSWGPHPRHYPAPVGMESWTPMAKRERIVATAMRFLGYAYQHHHIPDWDPPRDWPWKPTCAGQNGKGVDCSNLTGFVYNQAFGIRLNTDVVKQSEELEAEGMGPGTRMPIERIELPASYDERIKALRTGDLLYIRNHGGKISHVVIWVGPIGISPDGTPLVIDSHGEDVKDANGETIPCGVQLRPFRENSWYNRSASHAHRLFVD